MGAALDEVAAAAAAVLARVGPTVVGLGRPGTGSGVVVTEGRVVTNAHNLRAEEVPVAFTDGRVEAGRVAGFDPDGDLAVVVVDTGEIAPVEWRDEPVAAGTPVFGLSNPGGRGVRLSFGIVSATGRSFRGPRGRRVTGSVEHSAPLPRGSSGGPVVDAAGALVGVNTNRLPEGFYLALPADASLRARIDGLAAGRTPERVRLGVGIAPPHLARRLRRAVGLPDRDGLLVQHVEEGSAAHRADLRPGDLLVAAGDRKLAQADDLFDLLDGLGPGDRVEILVVRGADELRVTVDFGDV